MQGEQITMSRKDVDRLGVIQEVMSGHLKQHQAASQLGLGVRQVKRLVRRYKAQGAAGLVSRQRGRPSNRAIADGVRRAVMRLVRERYKDFGPTLACEKLWECHGHRLSRETLRHWMIKDGLWQPKRRRQGHIHQSRPRRPCLGELVQIDGSPHHWFEDRGPYCTLIVFIDDATGRLQALRFVPAETTPAYFEVLEQYLAEHGRPVAFYSDKHSVFRISNCQREELTQFTRALKTLDIAPIHANTPQAKGRVERANQTLQDRLVKELRLRGINDTEAANAFLPAFIESYNARFAIPPQSPINAHRSVLHGADELALILSLHHTRTLSKNLTFQFNNQEYQLQRQGKGSSLRGAKVTVCGHFDGQVTVLYKGCPLAYQVLGRGEPPIPLDDEKSLQASVELAKNQQVARPRYRPRPDHPWNLSVKVAQEKALGKGDISTLQKRGHF